MTTEQESANACFARICDLLASPGEVFPRRSRVSADLESLIANGGGTITPEMERWTVTPNQGESIEVSAEPEIFKMVTDLLNAGGINFGIYPDGYSLTIPLV